MVLAQAGQFQVCLVQQGCCVFQLFAHIPCVTAKLVTLCLKSRHHLLQLAYPLLQIPDFPFLMDDTLLHLLGRTTTDNTSQANHVAVAGNKRKVGMAPCQLQPMCKGFHQHDFLQETLD